MATCEEMHLQYSNINVLTQYTSRQGTLSSSGKIHAR